MTVSYGLPTGLGGGSWNRGPSEPQAPGSFPPERSIRYIPYPINLGVDRLMSNRRAFPVGGIALPDRRAPDRRISGALPDGDQSIFREALRRSAS